jgi:hypothetical protein
MRHSRRGIAAIAVGVALVAVIATAGAKTTKSYCHPGGDYCVAIIKHRGETKLDITTPGLIDLYRLCAKRRVNGARECHQFRFKPGTGGLDESRIDFQTRFGGPPSGTYCATWSHAGKKLHTLCFNYKRQLGHK